jgi:hypothetical protein
MKRILILALLGSLAAPATATAERVAREGVAVSLLGSRASMERQNRIAREEQYSFLRTPSQVRDYVDNGRLVFFEGNADYGVIAGYPFARPVVRAFVERLSARYREACGEKLIVTSLTRPATKQPGNASPLSVHPAGMAVDLRVSRSASCLEWLEKELLELEDLGLIDATRERTPPHFHIAVFPAPFEEYDRSLAAAEAEAAALLELELAMAARADSVDAAAAAAEAAAQAAEATIRPSGFVMFLAGLFARLLVPLAV